MLYLPSFSGVGHFTLMRELNYKVNHSIVAFSSWTNISPLYIKMTLDCCQNRSKSIVDLKSK